MIPTHRRGFLGRMAGAVSALAIPTALRAAPAPQAAPPPSGSDAWTKDVKGAHRTLFDFPQHRNALPLLHIFNYLNTYGAALKAAPGTVSAVGTFYGMGPQASISLAFNDAMWAKYRLGEYLGVKDASGKAYTRNVFQHFGKDDGHLLFQGMQSPVIPALAPLLPALSIESLQKMGTTFLLCANALGGWVAELEVRGKGKAADLDKELRANLLPGVVIVPAMVIAIEQAQAAGIKYNRQ